MMRGPGSGSTVGWVCGPGWGAQSEVRMHGQEWGCMIQGGLYVWDEGPQSGGAFIVQKGVYGLGCGA